MTKPSPARTRRPWRDRRIAARRADIAVVDAQPLAELRIYESLVLLTRREGMSWRQYPVSPEQIAHLFGKVPTASGLLPPHTLGTGMLAGAPFYVTYVPARTAALQTAPHTYRIPLPPLIWCGHGRDYRIWAASSLDMPDRDVPLFKAPFPNCYADGRICWGDVSQIPKAGPKTLPTVLRLFLEESIFNLHVTNGKSLAFPVSVVARWQELEASDAQTYPLDDLMPAELALSWALGGKPWGGGW